MISKFRTYICWFLVPYALLLIGACALLATHDQQPLHLLLNTHHTPALDLFMHYYSILAQWPLYLLALIPLCWRRTRWITLMYATSEALSALLTQALKHILHMPRPATVFANHLQDLPLVTLEHLHHSNSFPSGHAATFFVFFATLAILLSTLNRQPSTDNPQPTTTLNPKPLTLNLLCLLLATLGAYSRVYLSQHFLLDITVGSLIGTLSATLVSYFFIHKKVLNNS